MNLVEVVVAASVFLGACGGAAQLGASSTQALQQSRQQQLSVELSESQFLAVPVLVRGSPQSVGGCAMAAQWMQQQLLAGLPALPQGFTRSVAVGPQKDQVVLTVLPPVGPQRLRLFNPAAFGLCAGGGGDASL